MHNYKTWKSLYYISIFWVICINILIFFPHFEPFIPFLIPTAAYTGFGMLTMLLVLKNIGMMPIKHPIMQYIRKTLKYQKELGMSSFFFFLSHGILAAFRARINLSILTFQSLSALVPVLIYLFLVITSSEKIQKKIRQWKKKQSVIWLIVPFILFHEFWISNSVSPITYIYTTAILLSVLINLLFHFHHAKKRKMRQLFYIASGILLVFLQFSGTKQLINFLHAQKKLSTKDFEQLQTRSSADAFKKSQYNNGTFIGFGVGGSPLGFQVAVTIYNDIIQHVEIINNQETPKYTKDAFKQITHQIISEQTFEFDTVAGATRTCEGIKEAIDDALAHAQK